MRVYTLKENRFIYNKIEDINSEIIQGIGECSSLNLVEAIVLGGGYGRGEGCISLKNGIPQLHNDLEYYLFRDGSHRTDSGERREIVDFMKYMSERHGIDIEIFDTDTGWLDRQPVTMFTYDLVSKSHIIYGDQSFFSRHTRHLDSSSIEISEAERLLYNRLSGILFSLEKINRGYLTQQDTDFVVRNIAKLKLSLGDACLTVFGNYHWSTIERNRALRKLFDHWVILDSDTQERIVALHDEGMAYRMNPSWGGESLRTLAAEIDDLLELAQPIWQWTQNESLEQQYIRARNRNRFQVMEALRDRVRNLRYFGISDSLNPYNRLNARERLKKCLWDLIQRQRYHWVEFQNGHVARLLNTFPEKADDLISRYQLLWSRLG
jgi:hypothetical protein